MGKFHELDIYQRVSRNRLRLALAFTAAGAVIMAISGVSLFFLYKPAHININFWVLLSLFWLCFAVYVILRYALGGKWVFKRLITLPPWETDHHLRDALVSVKLASGMAERVRLMVIPDPDINTLSLSLPDGSYALFATQGIADKLPEREREAIIAHEIAHMQMGDTLIHTLMVRLAGRRALKKITGRPSIISEPFAIAIAVGFAAALAFALLSMISGLSRPDLSPYSRYIWITILILFIVFAALLPFLMNKLLQRFLDKEREYYADMQAVYLTRDPDAVYQAIKNSAEDVRDVLLLPACFDALLFNPVVDYMNYKPFRSQPTMAARMQRLKEAFPQINS